MEPKEITAELIKCASKLILCRYLPSDLVDDYPQKTYSSLKVAKMMEKAHDNSKNLGVEVARLARMINE